MKPRLIARPRALLAPALYGGILTVQLVVSTAHAQSSTTLYGVVDTGIEYVNNIGAEGKSVWRMPTLTGSLPSRWGIRGLEDIGGGNKVIFTLESGFAPANGIANQGGRLFGRQALVGVATDWGTLSIGRQYTMSYFAMTGADVMGPNAYTVGIFAPYLSNARADNSIVYRVGYAGFDFGATYSLGRDNVAAPAGANCPDGQLGDSHACRGYSVMLRYEDKSFGAGASYERIYGAQGAAGGLTSSSLQESFLTLSSYGQIGSATVGGGFVRHLNDGRKTGSHSDLTFLGISYPVMGALTLAVQFGRLTYKDTEDTSEVVVAKLAYALSRRSSIYLTGGHVWNHGNAAVSVSGSMPSGAQPAPGQGQSGFLAGVKHTF